MAHEVQAYKQVFEVRFKNQPSKFVPESEVMPLYEAKTKRLPVLIDGEMYDSNEILSVTKHFSEGKTARDILPEFQPDEREWVKYRIKQRMESVGKTLMADEARRYVALLRENPELQP